MVALLIPEPKSQRMSELVPKEKLAAYLAGQEFQSEPKEGTYRRARSRAWGDLGAHLAPARAWAAKTFGVDLIFRELPVSQCADVPLALLGPRHLRTSEYAAVQAFQHTGGVVCRFADLPNPYPDKGKPWTSRINVAVREAFASSTRIHVLAQDPFAYDLTRVDSLLLVRSDATFTVEDAHGTVLHHAQRLADGRQQLPAADPSSNPYAHFVRARWQAGASTLTRAWSLAEFADTVQRIIEAGASAHAGGVLAARVKTSWQVQETPAGYQHGTVALWANDKRIAETTYTTDARGFAHPKLAIPPNAPVGAATLRIDDESMPVEITSGVRLSVVAERPIYRENDEVHVRVMAHRAGDGRPIRDLRVQLQLRDSKVHVTTSKHGIASHTFPLVDAPVGGTAVHAKSEGAQATCEIRIREFERPTFTLEVEPATLALEPGASAPVLLSATYVNGTPMVGARIFSGDQRGFRMLDAPIATDAQGRARFVIQAPRVATPERSLYFQVRDVDGRTADITVSARAGSPKPRLEVRAISDLVAGAPGSLEVHGPSGTSLAVSVESEDVRHFTLDASGRFLLAVTPSARPALDIRLRLGDTAKPRVFTLPVIVPGKGEIALALARRTARVGESLEIVLRGPSGAVNVDVWKQNALVHTAVATLADGGATLRLPLDAALAGVLRIHATPRDNPGGARRASVLVTRGRALHVETKTRRPSYRPGEQAQVDVEVRDASGAPTAAVLGYWGVDAALLALASPTTGHERVFDVLDPAPAANTAEIAEHVEAGGTGKQHEVAYMLGDLAAGSQATRAFSNTRNRCERLQREALVVRVAHNKERLAALRAAYVRAWEPLGLRELQTAESFPELLAWLVSKGTLDRGTLIDAWGTPYRLWTDQWTLDLHWESAGPDRRFSTPDDLMSTWSGVDLYNALPKRIRDFHEFVRAHHDPALIANEPIITDEEIFEYVETDDDHDWQESFGESSLGRVFKASSENSGVIDIGGSTESAFLGRGGGRDLGTGGGGRKSMAMPYVRKDFDPTLCFVPEVIVGPSGKTTLPIHLKDSITSWTLRLVASSAEGAVGVGHGSIRVQQPLHASPWLAPHLTVGDVVTLPVAVRNESDTALDARVDLAVDANISVLGRTTQTVHVAPYETGRATFRLEATSAGSGGVRIRTSAGDFQDAQERIVVVHADARIVQDVHNTKLGTSSAMIGRMQATGPGEVHVDLYASPVAELLSGFDGLIRAPHG